MEDRETPRRSRRRKPVLRALAPSPQVVERLFQAALSLWWWMLPRFGAVDLFLDEIQLRACM